MKRKTILIGYGIIVLWMILPMISVFTASAIAEASGCSLDEGSAHQCVVLGTDIGESLYTMFVLGWMFFLTVPTGLVALVLFTVIVLVSARSKRIRSARP
ncbi:MAG TPA: hypothetical protein VF179_08195 [Thermoanaerobaculia bacterium]|nr:hypothetical protein [Thermoanaerobaculia bacterium]